MLMTIPTFARNSMSMRTLTLAILTAGIVVMLSSSNTHSASLPRPGKPDDLRVTFISNNAHEFWKLAEAGVRQAEKDLGVKADFRMPAQGNAVEQRQIIEDLITQGVKHFAVSPNDASSRWASI